MNRLFGHAEAWWGGRTLRERRMLMVMVVLLLATFVSLGVVRPLLDWRASAADRARAASTTLAEVRGTVASFGPARTAVPPPAEGLEPLVRRTADLAGVQVVTTMSPSGQLGFQLSRVASGPLFSWLSALETDHRLTICSLGVTENADATLNVEGSVSTGVCGA
jgi:general secretion pathway protein M